MEATIPWDDFYALRLPVYDQLDGKGGRPQLPMEVMLRIHLLQQWLTFSEPLMEEILMDTHASGPSRCRDVYQIIDTSKSSYELGSDWRRAIFSSGLMSCTTAYRTSRLEPNHQGQQVQRCGSQHCHHFGAVTAVTLMGFSQSSVTAHNAKSRSWSSLP